MRWLLKRWWFWLGMLLPIPIVSGYLLFSTDDSPINQTTFARIQLGWTQEQVDAIFGDNTDVSLSVDAYDEINEVCVFKGTNYLDNQITLRLEAEKTI